MNRIIAILVTIVAVVAGIVLYTKQPGLRFEDVALNKNLPKEYKGRSFWKQADVFKYDISQLAGHIIIGNLKTGEFRRGKRYLSEGYEPKLEIVEKGLIYTSKVDHRASAAGSFLSFAGDLAGNQTAEVAIADASYVLIPMKMIPQEKLAAEAERTLAEGEEIFYIQGVVLATVTIRNYSQIDAKTSMIKGDAFSAEGKIYCETGDVSKDYQISLTLLSPREFALNKFTETTQPRGVPSVVVKNIADAPLLPTK